MFPEKRNFCQASQGFTFIEMAIVLIIVGVILSIGAASWITFMEGRRVAKTRSVLQQAKDCLVKRVVFNERYPRTEDFGACINATGKDGWNRDIKCLVGVNSTGTTLDGTDFVVTDDARNQNATVLNYDTVQVITVQGNQTSVAFVLYSLGDNGLADDTSYDGADWIQPLADLSTTPDFTPSNDPDDEFDDIFLVVKSYELAAAIKNAVGH
ncbi:MAG: prepilin-type N-terminal cleavage/methylation domain-containing protein [Desulfoplanes sp.]|nr:prepilin-type N-terminal cleavage/methylation domain-containing protein [Desulfoplanes sp.]